MRKALWFCFLFLSLAGAAAAAQDGDLVMAEKGLLKSSFVLEKISYDLRVPAEVNVLNLTNGISPMAGETAESIHAKIDLQRQKLYPDKEIILTITIPKPAGDGKMIVTSLVKAIYWWNNTNAANYYWYAQYTSTVATMFTTIKYGKYKVYDRVGSGAWVYRYFKSAGTSCTRYSWGPSNLRGFKGVAYGVTSMADIVMYFFN